MDTIFIPVISGTVRQGRMNEPIAKFIFEQVQQQLAFISELLWLAQTLKYSREKQQSC